MAGEGREQREAVHGARGGKLVAVARWWRDRERERAALKESWKDFFVELRHRPERVPGSWATRPQPWPELVAVWELFQRLSAARAVSSHMVASPGGMSTQMIQHAISEPEIRAALENEQIRSPRVRDLWVRAIRAMDAAWLSKADEEE